MQLYLRDDIESALRAGALGVEIPPGAAITGDVAESVFDALFHVAGQVYRQAERRRTLRCDIGGRGYFAKLHDSAGWRRMVGSWASLKRAAPGARDEYRACRRLRCAGVLAPGVAAFGERGRNPATRRSFVLCDALDGFVSLEEIGDDWALHPKSTLVKRRLLASVGALAARMHAAGVCHRDFYLCHLLANAAKLDEGEVELAVIDLHRAVLGRRAGRAVRVRDLGALLYSAAAVPLTRTDLARFVAAYTGCRPAWPLRRRRRLWAAVAARAQRLRSRGLATGTGALTTFGQAAASIGKLADIGRQPPLPFRFDANFGQGGQRVVCTQLLRVQPGRRLVARARIAGQDDVVIKAFYGRRAQRDQRREHRGHRHLASAGVPVPRLLRSGRGAGAWLLCFEFVARGRMPGAPDIGAMMRVLARLHAAGVRQRDLHLGNFLVAAGEVYAMDGSGVVLRRMGVRACLRDVARLLADLSAPCRAPDAVAEYARARGWTMDARDRRRFAVLLARARRRRAIRFLRKTVRDCTPFAVHGDTHGMIATARGDADHELNAVIADPERAVSMGQPLKQGRSATVVRYGGLVVKRYAVKSRAHRWRLRVRRSRARRAWQNGHALRLLDVPSPRPRGLIERSRAAPGSARAYLVLDHVPGTTLAEVLSRPQADTHLEVAVRALFDGLRRARLIHGDMKATNFVMSGRQLHVLDLDAARFHRGGWWFERRHRRDRERFLRNVATAAAPVAEAVRRALAEPG